MSERMCEAMVGRSSFRGQGIWGIQFVSWRWISWPEVGSVHADSKTKLLTEGRLNKLYRSSIKEDEILEIMKPMIRRYAKERIDGERFGDWTIRAGYIKATREGRDFHEDVSILWSKLFALMLLLTES
jgi:hypothetical protein